MPGPVANKPPEDIYAVFCGSIDPQAVQRLFGGLTLATTQGVKRFHLLFQSSGGIVGDGVCLYNFFKSLTIDLILYNVGSVASIATISYLGAKHRKTSARALFMLHRTHFSPQGAKAKTLKTMADTADLEDERTEAILRSCVNFSDEHWKTLDVADLYFTGEDAVKVGIATEVGEFSPPPGAMIYNI
jgi:ATP-dependent protease ClpP protease subunit